MAPDGVGDDLGALLDVQVPGTEPERCEGQMLDAPVCRTLECAAHRLPDARARHRLGVTRYDAVNEELYAELPRGCHDGGADRERLVHAQMTRERLGYQAQPATITLRGPLPD